ncbi:MAG: DJ-1/PfpI family protein, partial [Planctomycetia bacterium]
LDDEEIATLDGDGSALTVPSLWSMPDRGRLGIGAWDAETVFHRIEVRAARDGFSRPARAMAKHRAVDKAPAKGAGGRKRVLLVIANHHFFYREYAHPRQELEEAGIRVTVAAGRRAPCRPHQGSGEGAAGGVVTPDVALADVKASDYDAILFSGGWGSSAYQYAFDGRYDDAAYNGDRAVKAAVNRIIGEFVAQDKYVAALCNAVSVLAWARIDGASPLRGKQVCAPTRQAAPGYYDGRPGQPSCRWHPERNGAVLSPAGAIGLEGTAEDDVLVDGLIVTGEDDISAREMGRRLVELLSTE